ncbi:hypothetical protein OCH239_22040 [Roseivivax halodurans JCM 10272]|uniref:Bifunctional NAD(P)H-hydrate repair enzyme n=1 Tax=Roseivivax halodurans JCM 10272 TaxID=1449350 RepID=X7EFG6_9RHOB|nr:bifunctional ADP-dependent NAD(P)H-hydrate dehydratase/NAD(P)H-hydrate epimerase [Roseivivax halodurans]ETX14687.1 hypothetical protein OCH239_22040 [Roseivivax halodurans JCM 10272]
MTHLLTAQDMREIERSAMEDGIATGAELMERAGRRVVEALQAEWPDGGRTARRAIVLCGPGNNGGDGYVVARLLHGLGWSVSVHGMGATEELPPDARANRQAWEGIGSVVPLSGDLRIGQDRPDLVVDALFGTGLTRPVDGLGGLFRDIAECRALGCPRVVAVDLPSGLCSDSGRVIRAEGTEPAEAAIAADLTVTFHRPKLGHYLSEGPSFCSRLVAADIGLRPEATAGKGVPLAAARAAALAKNNASHKYDNGHALVLTGGSGRTGAARLAARGALRAGAGLVTVGVPASAQLEVAAQLTAIMLTRVDDGEELASVLEDTRLNALCLGPGLGRDRVRALVPVAVKAGRGTVLDADALTAFEDDPAALFADLHEGCILTPHMGEFSKLFPDLAAPLKAAPESGPATSRLDAARAAAARSGATVLLKGPDTVIASPGGAATIAASVYERAAPWLATAGTGDVLAGIITGLLARGFATLDAAASGAFLHAEAARGFGPGLVAEDLPEELPRVFRALGV